MRLSVIVIEYFSKDDLTRCISSLERFAGDDAQIIISSNSCYPQAEREALIAAFPRCKWIFNPRNGGYAYSLNRGLEIAGGEYIAVINPDAVVMRDISPMIDFLQAHPEVGVVAPKMVDDSGAVQDSARSYVSLQAWLLRQAVRVLGRRESVLDRNVDYSRACTVDWAIGAFMLIRRQVYEKVGGECEDYFLYNEDMDWCLRIRKAGWETVYFPSVTVKYKGTRNARSNRSSARIFLRSIFMFWRKFGFFGGYPKRRQMIYEQ